MAAVFLRIACAKKHHQARDKGAEFREVFRAHEFLSLYDIVGTDYFADCCCYKAGNLRIVDSGTAQHIVLEVIGAAVGGAGVFDDLLHPFRYLLARGVGERPVHACQFDRSRHDIEPFAAMDCADIDDNRRAGVIDSAGNRLEALNNSCCAGEGVCPLPGGGAVARHAFDCQFPRVGSSHK